jgi:hypothetical protein
MKLLLFFAACLFMTACSSQGTESRIVIAHNPVADETIMEPSGKNLIKVVSANVPIVDALMKSPLGSRVTRAGFVMRKDRHGNYPEYTLVFSTQYTMDVITYFENLKKQTNGNSKKRD